MNVHKDSKPAFPIDLRLESRADKVLIYGMSLRDYFAAAVLQGLLANPEASATGSKLAAYAYRNADAMLDERAKGGAA